MYKRKKIENLKCNEDGEAATELKLNGEIEKIIIKFSEEGVVGTRIKIETEDGEILLDTTQNGVYYPRNLNVLPQQYIGRNMADEPSEISAPRYVVTEKLIIKVLEADPKEKIEKIEVVYYAD